MFALCSGYADVFNWNYEQGEGDSVNFFQIMCLSVFDTQEKLLAKISEIAGFTVKASDVSITASDAIVNLTVSGLYTVNAFDDYVYCDSPKKTDKLFEIIHTFSVKCFDFKPVDTLVDNLKAQGAEVFD